MIFIKRIINYFKAKKIRKELASLNTKYFSSVDGDWRRKGYSKNLFCFPVEISDMKHPCRVSFLKGIDLVLKNESDEKRIFLSKLPLDVKSLVKEYVRLQGFSDEFVKSTEDIDEN